ncbi:MAG: prolyl oligopeptidase family serine peptidase [Eubacterium sp.]|nr:prolyl oligopeptidase family serine peptidase [Eubacterium sp.]
MKKSLVFFVMLLTLSCFTVASAEAASKKVYVTKGEKQTVKVAKATKSVKWKSSKKAVVKVKAAKKGLILQAKKKGSAVVKGTVKGKKYTFKVTVESPKISKKSASLEIGDTTQVKIKGTKRKVKWKTSDEAVAEVSSKGEITAVYSGEASVYAKLGKKKYTCKVTVATVTDTTDTTTADQTTTEEQKVIEPGLSSKTELFPMETTTIKIPNGDRTIHAIKGYPTDGKTHPVIIMSHGYNGVGSDFFQECKYYAKHGYIAVSLDLCGGSVNTKSTGLKTTEMTIFTEKEDVLAAYDYMSKQEGVDPNRIYVMGGSQGGLVTALAAADLKEKAKAAILYFPALGIGEQWTATFPDVTKIPETYDLMGMTLGRVFFEAVHGFKAYDVIGQYENPVLILHGDADTMTPLSGSEKAVEVYKNAELIVLPGECHGFYPEGRKTAMIETLHFMEDYKN